MQFITGCQYCGMEVEQPDRGRTKYYCDDECRRAWWRAHPEERTATPKAVYSMICIGCGEEFLSYGNKKRKYCCHEHYVSDRFNKPFGVRKKSVIPQMVAIGKREGIKRSDMFEGETDINTQSNEQERLPILSIRSIADSKSVLVNPNEIIAVSMPNDLILRRIFLVCGATVFRGKYDHFSSLVPQALEMNMMNGDVFVFCNRHRTQISLLQWQGDGFALYFKRTEYIRFPWPLKRNAEVIEIAREDLKMLLEYPRLMLRLTEAPASSVATSKSMANC